MFLDIPIGRRLSLGIGRHSDHKKPNVLLSKHLRILNQGGMKRNREVLSLFLKHNDLIKHIYSLNCKKNISYHKKSFMTLISFLRFCQKYQVIPSISSNIEVKKMFRVFQFCKDKVDFAGYVGMLCVIGLNFLMFLILLMEYPH